MSISKQTYLLGAGGALTHDFSTVLYPLKTLTYQNQSGIVPAVTSTVNDFLNTTTFDLCLNSRADFLVTADKRILKFEPPFDLRIITFNEWRNVTG